MRAAIGGGAIALYAGTAVSLLLLLLLLLCCIFFIVFVAVAVVVLIRRRSRGRVGALVGVSGREGLRRALHCRQFGWAGLLLNGHQRGRRVLKAGEVDETSCMI
jgi:uncharacterized iron-regulated membrane protein